MKEISKLWLLWKCSVNSKNVPIKKQSALCAWMILSLIAIDGWAGRPLLMAVSFISFISAWAVIRKNLRKEEKW